LSVLTPIGLNTAMVEVRATQAADAEARRAQNRALRRAEDDVEEARARYGRVATEHGRVKVDLESQYEAALARLEALKQTQATASAAPKTLTEGDIAALVALTERAAASVGRADHDERRP
jgi:phage-related tail protein